MLPINILFLLSVTTQNIVFKKSMQVVNNKYKNKIQIVRYINAKKHEYIQIETNLMGLTIYTRRIYANGLDISISWLSSWNSNDLSGSYYYHHANSERQSVRQ